MANQHDKVLTPELIRIIKIFGIGSFAIVFLLSFFNEKRADNSGNDASEMRVATAERIYFKNIRASYYDIEAHKDAKMTIYRYGKRIQESPDPILNLSILINRIKDEAYLYVEPTVQLPLKMRWESEDKTNSGELLFAGGDKFAHFYFVKELYPLLLENMYFELLHERNWIPIIQNQKEKEALRITCVDYFRLINP